MSSLIFCREMSTEDTKIVEDEEDDELDLLGGLDIKSSEELSVPNDLIDQVIGQERARNVIRKASKQGRHVLMIGSPGTGKSMLAKAMAESMPTKDFEDVLLYPNDDDDTEPEVRLVQAGQGQQIIDEYNEVERKIQRRNKIIAGLIGLAIAIYSIYTQQILFGFLAVAAVFLVYHFVFSGAEANKPRLLIDNSETETAPFNDATGTHSGALLGDVRHDPYQSGRHSTPTHKRVESGAIHESNKGVLFIDEINTLDIKDQQKLMTAIQEGEFSITGQSERSSGSMVQTDPVPCDFVMVAAGNMDAMENMHPALRSRLKGYGYEVYMDDRIEDTKENRQKFAQFIAQEVNKDENIPHFTKEAMEEVVLEARRMSGEKGKLTLKLRDLGGLIRDAGDIAIFNNSPYVEQDHVLQAKETSQSIEQQVVSKRRETKEKYRENSDTDSSIGRVNGLAVMGQDSGIVLPITSTVTQAQGEGRVIATGKLQEIAQEAVQNVSALIKKVSQKTLDDKDIHVQFVQTHDGVDGDSASVTVATSILSSLTGTPINQDIAMTGSLSVKGKVLPVGGVTHKIEAAAESGIKKVIIPKQNSDEVMIEDKYKDQIEIVEAEDIGDVLEHAFEESSGLDEFITHIRQKTEKGMYSIDELAKTATAVPN